MTEETKEKTQETNEKFTEPEPVLEGHQITPFEGDFMDVTIQVAEHLENYGRAVDTVINFIIKRTYAYDWVCHSKAGTPIEEQTVNMIGAAAERIARDLGIQERNRTQPVKFWHDKEKNQGAYYYQCEGEFEFRGRKIKTVGIASTLNPFYGKEYGKAVDPRDIREDHIQRDCYRDCTKQAINGLFGLRKIPLLKLKELGFDISKVKFINFKSSAESQTAKNPEATKAPESASNGKMRITVIINDIGIRKYKDTPIIDLTTDSGKFSWWGEKEDGPNHIKLIHAASSAEKITLEYEVSKDGKYRNVKAIV